jgi:hypothetical protein
VTPNNTSGGVHFDLTVDVFDAKVVHEYLNGTGQSGGPLVTTSNVTVRSDLRIYESDNNVTMIDLENRGDEGFLNTCSVLFQRMIETVPKNAVLSDIIAPRPVKSVNATFDFDDAGNLVFSGSIRVSCSNIIPTSCNRDSDISRSSLLPQKLPRAPSH